MDELFAELAGDGWLVNNLYQLDDGSWRCNLRRPDTDGDWFTVFAEAPSAYDAIAECMDQRQEAEFVVIKAQGFTIDTTKPSLLSLGLAKPINIRRL